MHWVKFFLSLFITLLLTGALLMPLGQTPPLGGLFNPFTGFWQNALPVKPTYDTRLTLPGLQGEVEVVIDEREVPHVFAASTHDLYYAQGYLHARDRFWQMEFQVLAASGRLSEVLGPGPEDRILAYDQSIRRKGMVFGAERSLEAMMSHPDTRPILEAYTAGVNAYLDQLGPGALPLEYKLLGYQPEPWTPLKSALFLKYMADAMTGGTEDIAYTLALQRWGRAVFDLLYPAYPYDLSPVVPYDLPPYSPYRRYVDPIPPTPSTYHPDSLLLKVVAQTALREPEAPIGSNNWVIAGSRSRTGRPILANDPHLGLRLPAIWYEMQLKGPGTNAYGVTFPGAPSIPIGFNDSTAWGETNGGQDVMDYYLITYRDAQQREYSYDGQWLPISQRVETYRVKGGRTVYDTVGYTHIGPIVLRAVADKQVPMALRWTAHEPTNELLTFIRLNRARNYSDYLQALESYGCPGMNFAFATAAGDIAMWQQGMFVEKWREQGRFVLDASQREHMWQSFIPLAEKAHQYNPPTGFVSSANQHPAGPGYPHYYNGGFLEYRGRRIQNLLSKGDTLGIEDMMRFQLDTYSLEAEDLLPVLLSDIDTLMLDQVERAAYDSLRAWNLYYDPQRVGPAVFQRWWDLLYHEIWDDDLLAEGTEVELPSRNTTVRILRDSLAFRFYGRYEDTLRRSRQALVNQTFQRIIDTLRQESPRVQDWTWGAWKQTRFPHLIPLLESFGRPGIPTGGYGNTLNATKQQHGPSWRMVVALGPTVEAYGIYPGGQSGHPGSATYDAFIDKWVAGEYFRLWFMQQPGDDSRKVLARQRLTHDPTR
ncbi:MAG: penicillin acylase family protein [Bacteroidia bacterium]